jgi:hypothetical protein
VTGSTGVDGPTIPLDEESLCGQDATAKLLRSRASARSRGFFRGRGGSRANPFGDGVRVEPNACSKTKRRDVPAPGVLENGYSGYGQQRRKFVRCQRVVKVLDSIGKGCGHADSQTRLFGITGVVNPSGYPGDRNTPPSGPSCFGPVQSLYQARTRIGSGFRGAQAKISFTFSRVRLLRDGFK